MTSKQALLCATSAMAAMMITGVSHAQTTSGGPQLEEIVVTAQKREESLQSVPIAVSAVTAASLEQRNVQSTRDLQYVVPSLTFNQVSGWGQPFLRGIGSDIAGPNQEAGVATYVDGVFVSNNGAILQSLLGTERVEVLAGPQGTLYGRNAVGGAINIYTLTPGPEFAGRAVATYGNFDRMEASGYVSGPVSDTLRLGVYGAYSRRDPYKRPTVAGINQPRHELNYGGRAKLVWAPTDALKVTASTERLIGESYEQGAYRNVQANSLPYVFGAPFLDRPYDVNSASPQFNNTKTWGNYLRAELELDKVQLMSLTSYRKWSGDGSADIDGTALPIIVNGSQPAYSDQFSQELQLMSPVGNDISWIAGAYYFHENSGYKNLITELPVFLPPPLHTLHNTAKIITKSIAAFGQVTFPLGFVSDDLKLTLGGRYTVDKKTFSATEDYLNAAGAPVTPLTVFPEMDKTWKKFTPKVTLDYTLGDSLLYATYSKGFVAGAYNSSSPASPGPVNPETLTAYEVGLKTTIANRFRFNTAAYFYKFNSIQVQLNVLGSQRLQNAASAEAYGLESTLTAALTSNLTLNASFALEHTEYTKFDDAASYGPTGPDGTAPAIGVNARGNQMIRAPKFVSNLGATYNIPLANDSSINLAANWYYNDGFYWDSANKHRQGAYDLVDISAGYTFPGEKVSVRGWITNLTNSYYRLQTLQINLSTIANDAPPRMYGITLAAKF